MGTGNEGNAASPQGPSGPEFFRIAEQVNQPVRKKPIRAAAAPSAESHAGPRGHYGMICLLRTARVVTGNSPGSQHWQICTSAAALISM